MVAPAVQRRAVDSVEGPTSTTGLRAAGDSGKTHTVHDEHIRRHLDPPFEAMREALKAACRDWEAGKSHLWRGWNKAPSAAESRERYLMLRTLLNAKHAELFDELADALPPENEKAAANLTRQEAAAHARARRGKLSGAITLVNDRRLRGIDIDMNVERAAIRAAAGL